MTADEILIARIKALLLRHEGVKLRAYLDSVGKWTVGVGRNLDDRGLSRPEVIALLQAMDMPLQIAMKLLDNDIADALADCRSRLPFFDSLNEVRQAACVDMVFQMGVAGFLKFRKALAAMVIGGWDEAAKELLDSTWARQTPARAAEIADMIRSGSA